MSTARAEPAPHRRGAAHGTEATWQSRSYSRVSVSLQPGSTQAHPGLDSRGKRRLRTGSPCMRTGEPVEQAGRRLVWRRSIERHQRRWNPRDEDDVRPPAVGVDGHDLDLVRATTDGLFKAMNSRMHSLWTDARGLLGTASIVTRSLQAIKRSAVRNGRPQSCTAAIAHETKRNTFLSTSIQQVMHWSCTGFPQLDGAAHAPYAERT